MFINKQAKEAFEAMWDAIDASPVIPPCQTTDPELWFASDDPYATTYKVAKKLCERCPVRALCAEYAIANNEQFGVWGGLSPREREKFRATGQRGRPLKQK